MDYLSVTQVARRIGARPRSISDLLYKRVLDDAACPVIAGRRLIPRDYVDEIRKVLASRGLLLSQRDEVASMGASR